MDITSVVYTGRASQTAVAVTLRDGTIWHTDATLPADTDLRAALHLWTQDNVPAPYVSPAATPRRIVTVLEFRDRLTPGEEVAITQASMASAAVRVWLDRLSGAQEVNLDDPRTVAGLHAMAAAGLLAAERVTEIVA